MPKKKEEQEEEAVVDEEADVPAVGLKEDESPEPSEDWEKVEAIINTAKKAYEEGAAFDAVLATLIETLNALQSETNEELGGLGGGPELDLPPEDQVVEDEEVI